MPLITNTGKEFKRPWYDTVWFGSLLGVLCPWIIFFTYYKIRFGGMSLRIYLRYLTEGGIFIATMSLSVFLSNLLVFFIFIWTKRDKSARGVVGATILYAIFVAIMKASS